MFFKSVNSITINQMLHFIDIYPKCTVSIELAAIEWRLLMTNALQNNRFLKLEEGEETYYSSEA